MYCNCITFWRIKCQDDAPNIEAHKQVCFFVNPNNATMASTYILTPFYGTGKETFTGLFYCGYEDVRTLDLINISDAL